VFHINAANVYINNKPEPTKDMSSNNYYNVLSVDDSDDIGPMYQPKYNLPSYNNSKDQSKARKNKGKLKARMDKKPKCTPWGKWRKQEEQHIRVKQFSTGKCSEGRPKACVFATGLSNKSFGWNTWLGDTAASTHMGNSDEGMTDVVDIKQTIMIGNGKTLMATKMGTLHWTVFQEDGSSFEIELRDYNMFLICMSIYSASPSLSVKDGD
jgi:hypothetical protein